MEFFERFKVGVLWFLFIGSALSMIRIAYLESLKHMDPPEYFSGVLIYEDYLRCGLIKTRNMDRMGCQFRGEICSRLRDYQGRRIRIAGNKVSCNSGSEFSCSTTGDFTQGSFDAEACYDDYQLIKVFPAEEAPQPDAN